jgi:iron complex outermembrane receptor protein
MSDPQLLPSFSPNNKYGEGGAMSNTGRLCAAVTLVGLIGGNASAQNLTSNGAAPEAPDEVLQEVVVTSQRRVENLQQVSIAATALDAAALESKSVARLADLQSASPSLSITNAGQTQSVNIRGIGLASNSPNATAGVATYVDGLFQPPIVQANSFYDLAGVEVLRGPQGTLVGTNSTGGAIFINSRSPTLDEVAGYARLGAGNYSAVDAEGAINLPATEQLAFRFAGFYRNRDSYYTDVGPYHNDAGKLDERGGRLGILWAPGAFSAVAKLQVNDMQTGGYAYRPRVGTRFDSYRVGDERTLSFDVPTAHRERALIGSLELKDTFANGLVLRSLSGYQHKRIDSFDDIDGSQAPAAAGGQQTWGYFASERQYSEEINVISPTDGRFDWILGAYFQRNDIDVRIHSSSAGFPTDILPMNRRTTTGFFAQGNYHLTDALELQLGGRYSTYKATGTGGVFIGRGIPTFPPAGLQVSDLSGEHEDQRATGKVALNWTVAPDNLLYVFAARGYKPGGFNSTTSGFDPETVLNYEAGWKSTLLEGRLRTQVAAFYNDYSNFQFDVLEPATGQGGIRNVGNGTIRGAEAQIQGRFGGFGLDAGVAYVDSHIDGLSFVNTRRLPPGTLGPQCPSGVPSSPPLCFDYAPFVQSTSGGPSLYSPKWTYNAGVEYRFALSGDVRLTPRVNYACTGPRFTYIAYSPVTDRIAGYGLWSALLTLDRASWSLQAYGTNLTNKTYVSGQASASLNEFYGAPREYGVRFSFNF